MDLPAAAKDPSTVRYVPPEVIRQRAATIRREWSEGTRRRRAGEIDAPYEFPVCRLSDVPLVTGADQ